MTELQNGQVGIASRLNEGSEFGFYLTAERCEPPEGSGVVGLTQSQISSPERTQIFDLWLEKASILIVEDNLINQKVLRKHLLPLVRETHVVTNGVEAIDFLRQITSWRGNAASKTSVTAILLDIEMPVMGGLECIKEIRSLEQQNIITDHLMTIGTTANARREQILTAIEAGMDDVLTKPFLIQDLKSILEKTLRSRQVVSASRI